MIIQKALFNWLTAVLFPVAMVFVAIVFLLSPAFLNLEYHMPGFPKDDYGFTLADRLKWGKITQNYLTNNAGVDYLADLKFSDGTTLYNLRELSHLQDVKKVVKPVLWVGAASWVILVGLAIISYRWKNKLMIDYKKGLRAGGRLTVILLILIGVFAITSFWDFFTVFHSLFFKGDSWLFYYSDTLIRLFPMRFWQDAFLMVGLIALAGSLFSIIGLKQKVRVIES